MHKQAFVEISCAREKKWENILSGDLKREMRMRERGLETCVRNNLNPDALNLWPMPIFIFRESARRLDLHLSLSALLQGELSNYPVQLYTTCARNDDVSPLESLCIQLLSP